MNQLKWIEELPTWNKKHIAYMKLLKSMNRSKIELVVESLNTLRDYKVLSFGERKMLQLGQELLEAKQVKHLTVINGGRNE